MEGKGTSGHPPGNKAFRLLSPKQKDLRDDNTGRDPKAAPGFLEKERLRPRESVWSARGPWLLLTDLARGHAGVVGWRGEGSRPRERLPFSLEDAGERSDARARPESSP